tara:strand:+ start:43 stop:465 length:423 start_codon:yes stop_codon:yes gene_type:complete
MICVWTIILVTVAVLVARVFDMIVSILPRTDMDILSRIKEYNYHGSILDDENASPFRDIISPYLSPEDIVIFKEEFNNVYNSLSKLNDIDFNIFMMKYFDDYKISEISNQYHLTRSKIETSLKNSKTDVRKTLQRMGSLY